MTPVSVGSHPNSSPSSLRVAEQNLQFAGLIHKRFPSAFPISCKACCGRGESLSSLVEVRLSSSRQAASPHITSCAVSPHITSCAASPHITSCAASPHITSCAASPHITSCAASPHITSCAASPHITSCALTRFTTEQRAGEQGAMEQEAGEQGAGEQGAMEQEAGEQGAGEKGAEEQGAVRHWISFEFAGRENE
ncbi:hypothetical protein FHG87_014746 [Trinorchestia longiramus]|nr:hypothetical protein FHG87_014746 [Trinorchestia longiramus]